MWEAYLCFALLDVWLVGRLQGFLGSNDSSPTLQGWLYSQTPQKQNLEYILGCEGQKINKPNCTEKQSIYDKVENAVMTLQELLHVRWKAGHSFGIPIKKKIDSYQKKHCFLSKETLIRIKKKIPSTPLVLACWFPVRFLGCLVPWSPGPLVPWSSSPLFLWSLGPLVPWSSGPLVLWSLGRLVPWSPGPWSSHPLVLRPGLRVLGSALSRQGAFKVIWKSGHTSCEAL